MITAQDGDRVAAAAPFYGAPLEEPGPDWSGLTAKVEGHFAEDGFANEHDPLGTYDEKNAAVAWGRAVTHLQRWAAAR